MNFGNEKYLNFILKLKYLEIKKLYLRSKLINTKIL